MRAIGELAPRVHEQASRPRVEGVGGHPLEVLLAVDLRAQELVVGVVQSGKQRAILDAVRLEVLEPVEHGDDRAELGVGLVRVDEEVLSTLARVVLFPSGEAQLDDRRDAEPRPRGCRAG